MNEMFSPLALMQGWWQMGAEMQKNWLGLWQQGMAAGLPAAAWMPGGLPKVEARITPLETRGALAGMDAAARVSLRMAMPGCLGPAEMLLVEAVVARAPASDAPMLKDIAPDLLPGSKV
ncbi:MAG: hypothetical protein PHU46_08270 [Rhodocyclaceae bacterium]|nr:hypothetical protein [Rhodocyclaceae bacterium]